MSYQECIRKYEEAKRKLLSQNLDYKTYQEAVKALAQKYKI